MKRKTIALILSFVGMVLMLMCISLLFIAKESIEYMLAIFLFILSGIVTMLAIDDYRYAKTFNR